MPELDLGNVKGPQGKSAYQSALDAGYSGSEEAFNTAMAKAPGAVLYTAQSLSDAQKAQARGNINSAPGGFGLGELSGRTANSFADITGYGSYRVPSESGFAPDTSSNWGAAFIGPNLSYGTLIYARTGALMAVRSVFNGEVGPIEWINPPMDLGVEYRTIERHMGKPVYKKLVTTGQLPSAAGTAEFFPFGSDYSAGTYAVFSAECYIANNSNGEGWQITMPAFSNGSLNVSMKFSGVRIDTYVDGDWSSYYGFALLKYTKRTD